jgi:hypothetical protein
MFNTLNQGGTTIFFPHTENSFPIESKVQKTSMALFSRAINQLSLSLAITVQKRQITKIYV